MDFSAGEGGETAGGFQLSVLSIPDSVRYVIGAVQGREGDREQVDRIRHQLWGQEEEQLARIRHQLLGQEEEQIDRIRHQLWGQEVQQMDRIRHQLWLQEEEQVDRIRHKSWEQPQGNSELVSHLISLLSGQGTGKEQRYSDAESDTGIEVVEEKGGEQLNHLEYNYS